MLFFTPQSCKKGTLNRSLLYYFPNIVSSPTLRLLICQFINSNLTTDKQKTEQANNSENKNVEGRKLTISKFKLHWLILQSKKL